MGLATELCGMELEHPLMNAAGTCKEMHEVRTLVGSAVSAVVVGSITVEERPVPGFYYADPDGRYALNAMNLPNPGKGYYEQYLPEMVRIVHDAGKRFILSVAGFSPEEYARLVTLGAEAGVDLVELDLGSVTVWKESGQKRIISFDPGQIEAVLEATGGLPMSAKLSPLTDPVYLREVAMILQKWGTACITASNTAAFGYSSELKRFGAVSGSALKPIALGQVYQLRKVLRETDIIGVGGIQDATDVHDYLEAGATAVQVATAYIEADKDPAVFSRILEHLDRRLAV